ncbi:MAG: monothiol glutaredoxin, Grx4 family [Myxococcales bacterium]|nr:monothiol glutaredoxin, Grx4 family [Myxococcales bacterium]
MAKKFSLPIAGQSAPTAPAASSEHKTRSQGGDVQSELAHLVESNKILIFMKGSPQWPQCGFSARAAQILDSFGVSYAHVNVLEDPEIRQGIKEFSNWPTIPQIYVNGEFLGGSDILLEMYQNGELQDAINELSN